MKLMGMKLKVPDGWRRYGDRKVLPDMGYKIRLIWGLLIEILYRLANSIFFFKILGCQRL